MKKLLFTSVAILLYQVLPLLADTSLLLHWKMWVVIATAGALWLSQPAIRAEEAGAHEATDRHTIWIILAMAGVATIVPELEWAYFCRDVEGSGRWNAIGLVLMAGGTIFRIWAIRCLGQFFTTTVQTSGEQPLITTGPYALVRHPSYLGALVAILGIAVLLQAWVGLFMATAALTYAYSQRIAVEEAALTAQFGDRYVQYGRKVKRILPGIW